MKSNIVCEIGVNDYNGKVKINGKTLKSYSVWSAMLSRCYNSKYQAKFPTYIGCYVCSEWLSFSNFKIWFDSNYISGWALDKDILRPGNKEYGPDTCRFVPVYLNSLLTDSGRTRGQYPLGIRKHCQGSGYLMQCADGSGKQIQRYHKTVEEAVADYSRTKTEIVKQQVLRAFLEDGVKSDICEALLNRKW